MSSTETVRRLNWGCGPHGSPGWLNSDIKRGEGINISEDIRNGLPIESDSLDYVVSIHALPMIAYPDLVPVLSELRRMLKPDGVLRLALPDLDKGIRAYLDGDVSHFYVPDHDMCSLGGKFIVHMLWYGYSVSMFTADFIEELLGVAGFQDVRHCGYRQTCSRFAGITDLDDREIESLFVEATKPAGPSHRTVAPISESTNTVGAAIQLDPLTSGMASIPCRTRNEFDRVRSSPTFRHHRELLDEMGKAHADAESMTSGGYCLVCDHATTFQSVRSPSESDTAWANWPERLRCRQCGMDAHERATYWFTLQSVHATGTEIYVAERVNTLSSRFGARFGPSVVGSDPCGSVGPGVVDEGGRGEAMVHLPFPDERFDLVVCLDVLACVKDPKFAIDEIRRVLRPGGQLLLTVPFLPDQDSNMTRPRTMDSGLISSDQTISEDEPAPGRDPLLITAFGWELVDDLGESFPMVTLELYQSWQYGHLGSDQVFFRCVL